MKGRLTLHVNFLKQVPEGEAKMVEADQKAADLNNVYTIYIYVHHLYTIDISIHLCIVEKQHIVDNLQSIPNLKFGSLWNGSLY